MMLGKYIKPGQTITIKKRGKNKDIIDAIHGYMPYAIDQSKKRASLFKGKTKKETCKNIWNFLKDNITYIEDSVYFQDIKLPNRLIKERKGDCKSYSMFTASILECLGYSSVNAEEILRGHLSLDCPATARIVRIFTSSTFTGRKKSYQCLITSLMFIKCNNYRLTC